MLFEAVYTRSEVAHLDYDAAKSKHDD